MDNPINYWYQKYIALKAMMDEMMKGAVEGIVTTRSMTGNIVTAHVDYHYKDGQMVRVIIVKED